MSPSALLLVAQGKVYLFRSPNLPERNLRLSSTGIGPPNSLRSNINVFKLVNSFKNPGNCPCIELFDTSSFVKFTIRICHDTGNPPEIPKESSFNCFSFGSRINDSKKTDEGTTTFAGVTLAGTPGRRRFKVSAGDKRELLEAGSRLKVNAGTGSPVVKRF